MRFKSFNQQIRKSDYNSKINTLMGELTNSMPKIYQVPNTNNKTTLIGNILEHLSWDKCFFQFYLFVIRLQACLGLYPYRCECEQCKATCNLGKESNWFIVIICLFRQYVFHQAILGLFFLILCNFGPLYSHYYFAQSLVATS